ncbi:hypothetical protein Pmani_008393 [Petrolisthes manimaculis]|uniref:C2H2-type domain-containing protein n=1 Tax=Petrolisthes manimaculis TaxID=1843537 RepID=A0AAE1Q6R8_9EUCA|nr:hypothetical protein Pmani_008393 [Petrolisthes manimaculis]
MYTPAECPLCKRRFFNKYSAKRHMIQAHGENRFHTRPYARADPSCVSSTFSAALQAMGVDSGSSEVTTSLANTSQPYQQTHGVVSVSLPKPPLTYHQEGVVFTPTTSPRHQGYRDGSYPQANPGHSPPPLSPLRHNHNHHHP